MRTDDNIGLVEKVTVEKYNAVNDMPRWLRTAIGEVREIIDQIDHIEANTKKIPTLQQGVIIIGNMLMAYEHQLETIQDENAKRLSRIESGLEMNKSRVDDIDRQLNEFLAMLESK